MGEVMRQGKSFKYVLNHAGELAHVVMQEGHLASWKTVLVTWKWSRLPPEPQQSWLGGFSQIEDKEEDNKHGGDECNVCLGQPEHVQVAIICVC